MVRTCQIVHVRPLFKWRSSNLTTQLSGWYMVLSSNISNTRHQFHSYHIYKIGPDSMTVICTGCVVLGTIMAQEYADIAVVLSRLVKLWKLWTCTICTVLYLLALSQKKGTLVVNRLDDTLTCWECRVLLTYADCPQELYLVRDQHPKSMNK